VVSLQVYILALLSVGCAECDKLKTTIHRDAQLEVWSITRSSRVQYAVVGLLIRAKINTNISRCQIPTFVWYGLSSMPPPHLMLDRTLDISFSSSTYSSLSYNPFVVTQPIAVSTSVIIRLSNTFWIMMWRMLMWKVNGSSRLRFTLNMRRMCIRRYLVKIAGIHVTAAPPRIFSPGIEVRQSRTQEAALIETLAPTVTLNGSHDNLLTTSSLLY